MINDQDTFTIQPPVDTPPTSSNVNTEHRTMLTEDSGVRLDVVKARGYVSIAADKQGRKMLTDLGFTRNQVRVPGLLIPLWGIDGRHWGYQYRPDVPREAKDGKVIKYETPRGQRNGLDVPPSIREELQKGEQVVFITEGAKKADALASIGVPAINVLGVYGWRGKNEDGGLTVLPDWELVAIKGNRLVLAFDSDILAKAPVHKALERLKRFLEWKGADRVGVLVLPATAAGKTGVDDHIAANGATAADLAPLVVEELPAFSGRDGQQPADQNIEDLGRYFVQDDQIFHRRHTHDGEQTDRIANFSARICEQIIRDDGVDRERIFVVDGVLTGGRPLPQVQLTSGEFTRMLWPMKHWGTSAIIAAGQSSGDRVREVIQLRSEALERVIHTHTGWASIDGSQQYLMPTPEGSENGHQVELGAGYAGYGLPEHAVDPAEALRASLRLLDAADRSVTLPMLAYVYLAPLSSILHPPFGLWLLGDTGSFKSTLAALALSHFGSFTFENLPATWQATVNAFERMLFDLKDCVLVADDYSPQRTSLSARELNQRAEQVQRALGNQQARRRMSRNTKLREGLTPRGLLISTAEIAPEGESLNARCLVIEYCKAQVDLDQLTMCQEESDRYAHAMRAYVEWLRERYGALEESLEEETNALRKDLPLEGHARVSHNVALLITGWKTFLACARDLGTIDGRHAEDLEHEGIGILTALGQNHTERVSLQDPVQDFLNILDALYTHGRVVFHHYKATAAGTGTGASPGEPQVVGWYDSRAVYLDPEIAYNVVASHIRQEGRMFPLEKQDLKAALYRRGYLLRSSSSSGNKHFTTQLRINGHRVRVLKLNRSLLSFGDALGQERWAHDDGEEDP